MKRVLSTLYYLWLSASVLIGLYSIVMNDAGYVGGSLVWVGVFLASVPSLVNRIWCFDRDDSPSAKVRYPVLSMMTLAGVAWVLLTVSERGLALWLVLGCLGGFLLHSYWAVEKKGSQ